MPVLLVPLLVGAGLSAAAAGAVASGITLAISIGGSLLLNIMNRPQKQRYNGQVTGKQANPARVRAYGRCKLGGAMFFNASNGPELMQGVIHCEGPIDQFEEWWLKDIKVTKAEGDLGWSTAGVWPWQDKVGIQSQLGRADQTTNGILIGKFPDWWGDNKPCKGLALTVIQCILPGDPEKNFQKYFPSGIPEVRVVARCSKIYDPRDSSQTWANDESWKWSDNSAICILNHLTGYRWGIDASTGLPVRMPIGFGIAIERINVASFIAYANLCDQDVFTGSESPAEHRYRCWGTFTLDQEPREVMRDLLATCDGELIQLGDGTIGIRGGRWENPSVTITTSMVLTMEMQRGNDKFSAFNSIKPRYTEPTQDYQQLEGATWDDGPAQAAQGSIVTKDLDLAFVPSYTQALRLAKVVMAKGNPKWFLTLTCSLAALNALGERIVHVNLDVGINEDFLVTAYQINVEQQTVKITLSSLTEEAYAWNGEPPPGPQPPPTEPPGYVVPTPAGLALSLVVSTIGSAKAAQIKAAITPPLDTTLSLVAQYKKTTDSVWLDMTADSVAYTALSNYAEDGATYDVRVAFKTFGGRLGSYASGTIVVQTDTVAPTVPTTFAGVKSGANEDLSWRNPNSANFYATRIYRATGATAVFSSATLVQTVFGAANALAAWTDTAPPTGSTYRYWAKAINASGVASTEVGPVTQAF